MEKLTQTFLITILKSIPKEWCNLLPIWTVKIGITHSSSLYLVDSVCNEWLTILPYRRSSIPSYLISKRVRKTQKGHITYYLERFDGMSNVRQRTMIFDPCGLLGRHMNSCLWWSTCNEKGPPVPFCKFKWMSYHSHGWQRVPL